SDASARSPARQTFLSPAPPAATSSGAIVFPNVFRSKEHTAAAIKALSAPVPERRVYAHVGWRKLGGAYVYLHGDGAIGGNGIVPGLHVQLGEERAETHYRFRLPVLPTGDNLVVAVRASLAVLDLAPWTISVPA